MIKAFCVTVLSVLILMIWAWVVFTVVPPLLTAGTASAISAVLLAACVTFPLLAVGHYIKRLITNYLSKKEVSNEG